jgi:hypothetical protein
MSRDLLTSTVNEATTESRPATRTTEANRTGSPLASERATNLLERIERGWSGSRPESQNLWQLAGE